MTDTEMADSTPQPALPPDASASASAPLSATTSNLDVAVHHTTNEDQTKPRSPAITALGVSDSGPNDPDWNSDDPTLPYPQPAPAIAQATSPATAPPRSAVSVISGTTDRAESVDSAAPPLDLKLYTASGKLRKKKGWKGYVMVPIESDGNENQEQSRDGTPTSTKDEHDPLRSAARSEQLGRGSRRAATQRPPKSPPKPKQQRRKPRATKDTKEVKEKKAPTRPAERKRAVSELTLTSEEGIASMDDTTLTDDLSDIDDGSSRAPSPAPAPAPAPPKPSKAATAPRSSLQAGNTRQRTNSPKLSVKLNASTSAAPVSKGESTKGKPPAKRRKLSPTSGRDTPQPTDDSRAGSSAPSRSGPAAKSKVKQFFPSLPTARQEAAAAAKAQEEATKRERAQLRETRRDVREANNMGTPPSWVTDVDRPLKKMPRAGMGDKDDFSDAPPIQESSARSEPVRAREVRREKELKDEALLIIQQNKEANERKEKQRQREKANGQYQRNGHPPTPPPTGARSGMDIDDDSDGVSPGTPEAATTILVPTVQIIEEDFDSQFSKMMSYYAHPPVRHIMPTSPHDPVPPHFDARHGPAVKLAPKHRHAPRDKYDQDHVDGYVGLPAQFEREIKGFVDNVRGNVRQLTDYYYPTSSRKRSAFTERLGRELTKFGLQMTNDGEMAIQDAPRVSDSPAVQVDQ